MDPGWKDVLEVIVIPVTLGLIALLWPAIQSWSRRRAFQRLILRELEEVAPHPREPMPRLSSRDWPKHQNKAFVHQRIFDEPTANRDFILSLEPDLVYFVTQLWDSKKHANWDQWDYYLQCLSAPRWDRSGRIARARGWWQCLYYAYQLEAQETPLSEEYDYLSPSGFEIRLVRSENGGGLAHCTLPPGAVSRAIQHESVEELWCFIQGEGQVWHKLGNHEEVMDVKAGTNLSIPAGARFQLRNTAHQPLCFIVSPIPGRPDKKEVVRVEDYWHAE